MKKITLIIAAALVSVAGFAQNTVIDRPVDGTTGLISTQGNDGTGVYCADQFEVADEIALGEVTFFGFGTDVPGNLTGFNVYIFEDFSGVPGGNPDVGGGVLELVNFLDGASIDTSTNVDVTVALTTANGGDQVILQPGTYWICAFPRVDLPTPTAGGAPGRWNWFQGAGSPAVEPVLIDPQDLFGAGALDWTNISGLIAASFPAFAWTLTDEEIVLGVGDNLDDMVNIYPNPTTDVLNVSIPSNVEVVSTQLIDVLGRNTGLQLVDGQLNTSNLATGVYVLRIETSAGSLTRKIVKK
jgi:hypothetical protein